MYWDKLGAGYSRDNLNLVDPISGRKIKAIQVDQPKEIGTPAAPPNPNSPLNLTLAFHTLRGQGEEKAEDKGRISLFKGVDIRGGTLYIQTILNVFNCLWENAKITPKPEIRTYRCIPIAKTFGCIELLEPNTSAKTFDWALLTQAPESVRTKLVASLAGAITTSWVLGFRDKLDDYLFIHKDQVYFSSIDKIHLWNTKQLSSDFINNKIKPYLSGLTGGWNFFQNLCCETFKSLYEKGAVLQKICSTMYSIVHEKELVEAFIAGNKSLMLNAPIAEAQAQFVAGLNGTGSFKAKFMKKVTKFTKK